MSAHYRSPMNYSNIHLESASDRVYYIYEVLLYLARNCLALVRAFVDAVGKHNLFMHFFIILYMSCTIDVY
jgi:cysteinyl-tRNA synthetase